MSTTAGEQIVELTAEQMLTVRGAANAMVDAVDDPTIEIDDQFDPVRRDHAVAARDELGAAFEQLSPEGTWRGRMPPSEVQALRDAVGAIEAMVSPPMSERLLSLGYRPDDDDLAALDAALDGLPAPDRRDLAFSDFRYGGTDSVLKQRADWDNAMRVVRKKLTGADSDPPARMDDLRDFDGRQLLGVTCDAIGRFLIEQYATAASLSNTRGYRFTNDDVSIAIYSNVEDILDGDRYQHDCYREMDERRLRAAQKMISDAVERGAMEEAEAHAFGAAEMVLWAQSNRLREQRIGLR